MENNILLIFPGTEENFPTMPFSVVVLASYLRKHKIPVQILDTRIQDYAKLDFSNFSLIGISAKSGDQVSSAVELCRHIRAHSSAKIVWGGPHATFFPKQTCLSPLVDFVVKGEGEVTLLELINALSSNLPFKNINGLVYKENDCAIENDSREFMDLETLDLPAYEMIDITKYQDAFKFFSMETSRGCPYECYFCYVHQFHRRKWRAKSTEKVIAEIQHIRKCFGTNKIFFLDDNFYVHKARVIDFCQKVIALDLHLEIFSNARADYFAKYTQGELDLIRRSGFQYLGIGAESGSQRMLDEIHKDIKREDILNSAQNCVSNHIIPVYSFIIGMPGERPEDLNATIDMYIALKNISKTIEINGMYVFTPYPGTPIYDKAIKMGYIPRTSLEGWASWNFSDLSNSVWLTDQEKYPLQVISKIILFLFIKDRLESYGNIYKKNKLGSYLNLIIWNFGSYFLKLDALFRLKHKFFRFGPEWILFGQIALKRFLIN